MVIEVTGPFFYVKIRNKPWIIFFNKLYLH